MNDFHFTIWIVFKQVTIIRKNLYKLYLHYVQLIYTYIESRELNVMAKTKSFIYYIYYEYTYIP